MIKFSRFLILQRALNGVDPKDPKPLPSLTAMMTSFMIRGSQGPMQWMLDLRT